jgi:ribonuclease J
VGSVGAARPQAALGRRLIIVVAAIDAATGVILSGPDVVSRGFVYVRESEELLREAREIARRAIESCAGKGAREWNAVKQQTRDDLSKFLYNKTKRSPMILPVLQEI